MRYPLHHAAGNGNKEGVLSCLQLGQDINEADNSGYTPLHYAAYYDQADLVALLIQHGADANKKIRNLYAIGGSSETALHLAMRQASAATVEALISNGADINIFNGSGMTALHLAAEYGRLAPLGKLLESNANIEEKTQDSIQDIPLIVAARHGHCESMRMLLKYRANPHAINLQKDTALHVAAKKKHPSPTILSSFAVIGIPINFDEPCEEDPTRNYGEIIRTLLEYGADRHALNLEGQRPCDFNSGNNSDNPHFTDWNYMSKRAQEMIRVPASQLEKKLLYQGKPMPVLLELCGTRQLNMLFTAKKWRGHEKEALNFAERLIHALPSHWQQELDLIPDLAPLRRVDEEAKPNWLTQHLFGDENAASDKARDAAGR